MRRVGLLAAVLLPACFTIPEFKGPPGPDELDEDGDGIPDIDDPCPHIVAVQTDTDGDGIGNECDPHPTDRDQPDTALFYTFNGNSIGDLIPIGVVEPQDGSLLLGSTGSDAVAQITAPTMFRESQITTYYNILDATQSATSGLTLRMSTDDGARDTGGDCSVAIANGRTKLVAVFHPQAADETGVVDPTFIGSEAQFRGDLDLDALHCIATNFAPTAVALGQQSPLDNVDPILGSPAVAAVNTRVRLQYLFIAGRP
jgi:hypothetical protein